MSHSLMMILVGGHILFHVLWGHTFQASEVTGLAGGPFVEDSQQVRPSHCCDGSSALCLWGKVPKIEALT